MSFPRIWVQHLSAKDEKLAKEFEGLVRNSTQVLSRLRDILEEYYIALERSESREKDYESSNWAYLQAHRNGKAEAYVDVLRLLKFLDDQKRGSKHG